MASQAEVLERLLRFFQAAGRADSGEGWTGEAVERPVEPMTGGPMAHAPRRSGSDREGPGFRRF
jgi:hypothetical protein